MPYEDWLPAQAPGFLQRLWGTQFLGAIGLAFDAFAEAAKQGVRARFPEYGPPDAQEAIGFERQLPRFTVLGHEPNAVYGARLRAAWDDFVFARTRTGIMKLLGQIGALAPAPWTIHLFDQHEWNPWYSWTYAYALCQQPHPWASDGNWGDPGTYADGGTWGSSATGAQVANLRAVLHPWVPPTRQLYFVVNLGGELWGEPGVWGDPGAWGAAGVIWPM